MELHQINCQTKLEAQALEEKKPKNISNLHIEKKRKEKNMTNETSQQKLIKKGKWVLEDIDL